MPEITAQIAWDAYLAALNKYHKFPENMGLRAEAIMAHRVFKSIMVSE